MHEETAAVVVEPVELLRRVHAHPARLDTRLHERGRPALLELVEPVEGFEDLGRRETGLDERSLQRIAVDRDVGLVVEIVFEEVNEDV
jgi:hypothetical protein